MLHGTGGDESSLVEMGRSLVPGASVLGVKGEVNESGMNRWFKRYAEGVFDESSIVEESAKLAEFLRGRSWLEGSAAAGNDFEVRRIAVGYSNGANIGGALMLLASDVLDGLVMFRGMLPLVPSELPTLFGKKVLMVNGKMDDMGPLSSAYRMRDLLIECGAEVQFQELPTGHQLSRLDFELCADWLRQFA
jgi:phospholipase/carboxylesterase